MTESADRGSYRRIWALAWPTLVYSVLELSLGTADFLMVRGLGSEATAAIGLNRQVTFLLESAALAVATGVITLVSQGVGAGNRAQVDGAVRQSFRLVVLLGVPTTLVGYLASRPLLAALQASAETLAHGVPYLHIYFLGTLFLWTSVVAAAVFRGTGDTLTPLKLAAVVSVLNIGLNYVFVFGAGAVPAYGVAGAAIGTVAARGLGAAVYLVLLVRGTPHVRLRVRPWGGVDWGLVRRILRIGTSPPGRDCPNGARLVYLALLGVGVGASLHAARGGRLQVGPGQRAAGPGVPGGLGDPRRPGGRCAAVRSGAFGRPAQRAAARADHGRGGGGDVPARRADRGAVHRRSRSRRPRGHGAALVRGGAVLQLAQHRHAGSADRGGRHEADLPLHRPDAGCPAGADAGPVVGLGWQPEGALLAWVAAPAVQVLLMQRLFRSGRWRTLRV